MQASATARKEKRSFTVLDTAEPKLILCKDNARRVQQQERKNEVLPFLILPSRSLSYAKITYPTYIPKNMNQKMNRFHADTLPLTSRHNHENKTADTPPDSRKHARHTTLRQRLMTQKAHAQKRRKTTAQPTGTQCITKEAL